MKNTKKGQANDLTYGTKTRRAKPEMVAEPEPVPQKVKKDVKPKKEAKPKQEPAQAKEKSKGKIPYNFKLAQYNQRRRRGDVAKIAAATGFSQGYVSTVVNGLQDNERIVSVAYNTARGRKTNETMMKSKSK
jgi:hypothetical protein